MERLFQIVAAGLVGLAAYFFWTGSTDAAFAATVLGCVSFFLGIRMQMKDRTRIREEERRDAESNPTEDSSQ